MRLQRLSERLQVLETQRRARTWGAVDMLRALVGTQGKADADVIAVDVATAGNQRDRVTRRPGETLAALCRRACPGGSMAASPAPIFADAQAGESEAGEALRLMMGISPRLRAMVSP